MEIEGRNGRSNQFSHTQTIVSFRVMVVGGHDNSTYNLLITTGTHMETYTEYIQCSNEIQRIATVAALSRIRADLLFHGVCLSVHSPSRVPKGLSSM